MEMNTEVHLFVEHSSKGIVGSVPTPFHAPNHDSTPLLAPNQVVDPVDEVIEGDGNDSSEDECQSSEDEAAGIYFDDSEDERALGLDDGFDVVLENRPPPPQMVDRKPKKNASAAPQQGPNATPHNDIVDDDCDKLVQRKPKKNASVAPQQGPNATPHNGIVDDDVKFEMLAAELAATFQPTQSQPTINVVTNGIVPTVIGVTKCNATAPNVYDPDCNINSFGNEYILSQPDATDETVPNETVPATQPKKNKTNMMKVVSTTDVSATEAGVSNTPDCVKPQNKNITKKRVVSTTVVSATELSATEYVVSNTPDCLKPINIGKKKVAKKLDVKGLRRCDRTRILRCKNMKGPGSGPSQPITIDEEDIGEDQHVGTSSQPSLNDG
ncbi:hypothetical protein TSUD_275060 [Trifolium subterraneum]|uniref:Uncharacterized protein n=1 Tax=Trifolium subterraneum TaxID=3900 RepID=A0A2Z6NTR9_TRISU|nr:hypothetical protein TSUD_275060 [Trifolium subterraneum]